MALLSATLSSAMQSNMGSDVEDAAQALADSYGSYMSAAVGGGVPIASTAAPVAAMAAAMTFSDDASVSEGAGIFLTGLQAFWAVIVAAPATYFPPYSLVVPPTWSGFSDALAAVFSSNVSGEASLSDAMDALASVIHTSTLASPTVAIPSILGPFPIV